MSYMTAVSHITEIIQSNFKYPNERIFVLEAGCGSLSRIKVPTNSIIIGIDISTGQLGLNKDLNLKVCADLQDVGLRANSIDIICCWDVLEHLKYPQRVLCSFYDCIRPGGLIVLKNPNPFSLKGILTKVTPLWFHKKVHRHIFKSYDSNSTYLGPFKTYMRPCIHHSAIIRSASLQQILLSYSLNYTGSFPARSLYHVIALMAKWVTFGKVEVATEQVLVLKKHK